MTGLGLRLALAGGRGAIIGIVLTALAVALGTSILLFALSFAPALQDRQERSAWRVPAVLLDEEPAGGAVLMQVVEDLYQGEALVRIRIAPLGSDSPVPPGVSRLPGPGEAFVSPALANRMADVPSDQLADRIGSVIGTIQPEALRSPQELVALIGADPAELRADGASPLTGFATEPRDPTIPPIMVLLIVLAVVGALAPVAVFVATATRLSAARREQRLAALRLVGATPRQVTGLAVVEALLSTITGALIGVVLFVLLRPVVALVPLGEATWFPEAISPPLVAAVALLLAVPVVGALAAAAALRRIVVTPLGVQRRTTPPPPGKLRLLPLVVSVAVLLGALAFGSSQLSDVLVLAVLGAAFAGIIGGIALAGPWLTAIVGRALHRAPRGAATLLASRRLTDDPRGSFGSIAGVVMAVFVASAFFTFAGYAGAQSVPLPGEMRPGHIVAELRTATASTQAELIDRLGAMAGVRSVLPESGADVMVDGVDIGQLLVETDGTSAVAERVRTAIAVEFPSSWVRRTDELATAEPIYTEFGRVVNLGVMGTMLLAGCSLAVAVTTWVLERRRQFAQLRSAGMPVSGLRKLVLLQAAAPLVCVAIFSAALGIGVTQAILILIRASAVPLPDASLALVLTASVLGALLMVGLMLPAIERLTRPDGLRME